LGGKMKDLLTDEEIKGAVQQLHNEMFPYLADALQEWEAIAKAQLAKLLSLIPDIEAVKREERERIKNRYYPRWFNLVALLMLVRKNVIHLTKKNVMEYRRTM